MNHRIAARLNLIRAAPFTLGNAVESRFPELEISQSHLGLPFQASPDQLARHQVVMGTTGAGKSKYFELFGRHLMDHLCGFTFVDPHGDTAEALLAYATRMAEEKGDASILDRLHYLKPSYDSLFAFDPFRYLDDDIPDEHAEMAFSSWLHTTADTTARAFLRGYTEAEKQVMVRLQRWLATMLTGVGLQLSNGRHLALADIFVLIDKRHPRHSEVFQLIQDRLPTQVLSDFRLLHSIKRQQDEDHYTESTINRLRTFFSPLTEAIFTNEHPSIDFGSIIQNQHILLVNLKRTKRFSRNQGNAIASLIINEIATHCENVEHEENRTPHHLIIDEASRFIGEDLIELLEQARKWRLSLCLGGQSFSTFRSGDLDMVPTLQSCCHTFISFQQRHVKDVQDLGAFYAYPNRILEEHLDVRDRPGGHVVKSLVDRSVGKSTMHADGKQYATGTTEVESWQRGTSGSTSRSDSKGRGLSTGFSPMMIDGEMRMIPTAGDSTGHHSGASRSFSDSESHGNATGYHHTEGTGTTDAVGESVSETVKQTFVPVTYEDHLPTGQPRYALNYQDDAHASLLTNLPDRFALVRMKGQNDGRDHTYLFRTADAHDVYEYPKVRREKVAAFTERLLATKPYIFTPILPHKTQDERIDALSDDVSSSSLDGPNRAAVQRDDDAPFPNQ